MDNNLIEGAIKLSDDINEHKKVFSLAAEYLLNYNYCTIKEINYHGGWVRSIKYGPGWYFLIPGDTVKEMFYLDIISGKLYRNEELLTGLPI